MHKLVRYTLVFVLFILLVAVRYFEGYLFYDPLLHYFELSYLDGKDLPALDNVHLFSSISFRYWLNTLLSLGILYLVFLEKAIVKFSLLFYACAFILLIVLYVLTISTFDTDHYLRLFYVRRLLIQPIFIILLLPAFYYQKRLGK